MSLPSGEWEGSHVLVMSFLRVLVPITSEIYLVTGNYPEHDLPGSAVHLTNVRNDPLGEHPRRALLARAFRFLTNQLRISRRIDRIAPMVDLVVFFTGGSAMLLPVVTAKLRRKRTVIIAVDAGASALRNVYAQTFWGIGGVVTGAIISVLSRLCYGLCDRIVVYSPLLVRAFGLERYRHKIAVAHRHFIDFAKLGIEKPLRNRAGVVGYVGRLSEEKGILNLLEAMKIVAELTDDVGFLVVGDGQLRHRVQEWVGGSGDKARFAGWVSHDELPRYLNEMKLVVLPSYTEGLPNVMLEAMACGTPVLATPVGGIPDVIRDGETGFTMENNSPQCIADNVLRALNHPDLERIARDARALVEREFTFEQAVDRYRSVLNSALAGDRLGN